jgi:hypothetical protein
MKQIFIFCAGLSVFGPAFAAPADLMPVYVAQAKQADPKFQAFSASRGEQFFHAKHTHADGKAVSCSSCHTDDPKGVGRNEKTSKEIRPMAPVANPERLTDQAKVEKWFKRNCQDVLERACTPQEKGDFLAYLLSIK